MEITLDNGRPGVLCCYQEDYHRRLDRPEGTWKRVAVPSTITTAIANRYYLLSPVTNCKGTARETIEEPRAKRAGSIVALKQCTNNLT